MVGDAVNVASRLQVLNKTCGTDILVSRNIVERLSGLDFAFESMGTFPIRGKTEQIEVFSVSSGGTKDPGNTDAAVDKNRTKRSHGNEG
jgi:class 3 adenylate cyclase